MQIFKVSNLYYFFSQFSLFHWLILKLYQLVNILRVFCLLVCCFFVCLFFGGCFCFVFFFCFLFFCFCFFAHGPIEYDWFLNRTIWPVDEIQTGTTTAQGGPRINSNEGVLHTPKISRNKASRSDAVYCHTQDILAFCSMLNKTKIKTNIYHICHSVITINMTSCKNKHKIIYIYIYIHIYIYSEGYFL